MVHRQIASNNGSKFASEYVGTEEGCCNAGIVQIEDRCGEGLKSRGGGYGEVDDLFGGLKSAWLMQAMSWVRTLCVVRYALPLLQCIDMGSFPGYVFGVLSSRVVRAGDVKSSLSPGNRTKPKLLSSITQLVP